MAEYRNALQYGNTAFTWDPAQQVWSGGIPATSPGYVTELLGLRDRVRAGQAQPWEVEQLARYEAEARAIPTRDIGSLSAAWQGDLQGQWTEGGWQGGNQDWWTSLDPGSPDVGPIMLGIRDRMDAGTATAQERALYNQVGRMAADWNWRASVPQLSDAFNPMGDQFFQALTALTAAAGGAGSFGAFGAAGAVGGAGAGATAGAAAAPSLGGVPLSTLSTIGQVGSYGSVAANTLGAATEQPWLQQAGLGLGVVGGLAGGAAGLGSLWNNGVQSLGDAAQAAASTGRVTGAVGRASGVDALQQVGRYLGWAGQAGNVGQGVLPTAVTDWQTQGGGNMDWLDYSWDYGDANPGGAPYDNWSGDIFAGGSPTFNESGGAPWDYGDANPGGAPYDNWSAGVGGGGGSGDFWGSLGSAGTAALGFLGRNANWLGPAAAAAGGLGTAALGANASNDAAAAQAAALNRGLDLQTAQWLQQQANQAPWMAAGQEALGHLQGRMGWAQPSLQQAGVLSGAGYPLPSATPGWTPQSYQGYTPGAVPQAGQYGYQGPAATRAADYRYTPGAVPTLQGEALLANDPGVRFRLDEGRRALEASAAARGGLLSGPAMQALQRQGQELSSQEYGQAWQRAAQQAQMREQWAQQAGQQNFGQALAAQGQEWQQGFTGRQQDWQRALQEAQLREQGQQFGWQSGLTAQLAAQQERQQYDDALYGRQLQQNQLQYGRDWQQREAENARLLDAYNAEVQARQNAWGQFAGVAGLGSQATGQLQQAGVYNNAQRNDLLTGLGQAQGIGTLGAGLSWQQGLGGAINNFAGWLASLGRR